jgi:hypothetical protein
MAAKTTAQGLSTALVTVLKPQSKRYDVSDKAVRGLLLRVSPIGLKSWLFCYKWHGEGTRIWKLDPLGIDREVLECQLISALDVLRMSVHETSNVRIPAMATGRSDFNVTDRARMKVLGGIIP